MLRQGVKSKRFYRKGNRPVRYRGYRARGVPGRLRSTFKPSQTFVETFQQPRDTMVITPGVITPANGRAFKVRISDIPQWLQYALLYKQYRINWVKVMVLPSWNTNASDVNQGSQNALAPSSYAGMARIAYAVNDSPDMRDPVTEAEVLQDNGAKIKSVGTKFQASFKPVPDVTQATTVGQIYTKQKLRQWFNFDVALPGNNPLHGALSAFISLPGVSVPGPVDPASAISYLVYYKVSFSVRDPQ